ncbi:polysaccharide deacetylase family protein [Noviherbaspirillum galbum]|uniref:Polysaccharide deacetylase family protein n=1 Tax=Noviherbaspirillum galbum TaxID=2709383 RepID=A0A6B3SU75_9BURK|nr:polysaccharide deacetylase family protein [Noviherbaspirillum galbum]NEX64141.1 polysaccharide deacetylase family protein [Noviherbaspirillum galbum]
MKQAGFRFIARTLSLSLGGPRLSILIYHRVLARPDPLFPAEVDAAAFMEQMSLLSQMFRILPLDDAIQRLRAGTLPPGAAAVTFDDGYADNADIALPILKMAGVPATFFIATGFLDGGRMWNDTIIEFVRRVPLPELDLRPAGLGCHRTGSLAERKAAIQALIGTMKYLPPDTRLERIETMLRCVPVDLPHDLMMRSDQVRALSRAGMGIGGHTVNHPILASVDDASALQEMVNGKRRLEDITSAPVTLFAYPNGKPGKDYHLRHAELARKAGFQAAVSTAWGAAGKESDPFQLPRFTPWDRHPDRFRLRMAMNLTRRNEERVFAEAA